MAADRNTDAMVTFATLQRLMYRINQREAIPYLKSINAADQHPYPFTQDTTILGRSKQADLVLGGDGVSREHARIRADEGGYSLTDTSRNGTYLNIQKLQHEVHLTPGDHIRMGETIPEGESYGTARLEAWIA